jgi:hypothetical protein
MDIRYVAQDFNWTDERKECVRVKIVAPLERFLRTSDFELSVHMDARKARHEMWVVLQTFNGGGNKVVRCQGYEFQSLVNEVSSQMRSQLTKKNAARPKFFLFARTA